MRCALHTYSSSLMVMQHADHAFRCSDCIIAVSCNVNNKQEKPLEENYAIMLLAFLGKDGLLLGHTCVA